MTRSTNPLIIIIIIIIILTQLCRLRPNAKVRGHRIKMSLSRLKVEVKLGKPVPTTWRKRGPELETVNNTSRTVVGEASSEGFSSLT